MKMTFVGYLVISQPLLIYSLQPFIKNLHCICVALSHKNVSLINWTPDKCTSVWMPIVDSACSGHYFVYYCMASVDQSNIEMEETYKGLDYLIGLWLRIDATDMLFTEGGSYRMEHWVRINCIH